MPCLRPWQNADAFNQPLDWDTSGVTDMHAMFGVRCSLRALPPHLQSRALSPSRCVHAPVSPAASRRPPRSPPLSTVCTGCDPWQYAYAFNQPLGWDTSRVTDMRQMFWVRCSPRTAPQSAVAALSPARCLHTPRSPAASRLPACSPPRTVCPVLATLGSQRATAFNQPLSWPWDTTRVTDMGQMFEVRASLRALAPNLQSRALSPARSPPRTVCPACDPRQGATAFNQPLGWDTSSVTNMYGMFDVRCAPRAPPPPSAVAALSPVHTPRSLRLSPPPSCLPARSPPHTACPCLRPSAGRDRLQPAPELGHVPRQTHALHVFRALPPAPRPLPAPPISAVAPSPLHAACTAIAPLYTR